MNTLNSWIDAEAVSGLGKALATPHHDANPAPAPTADSTPAVELSPDDFHTADHFAPAPFPDPESPASLPLRQLLRSIREKAELSGLITQGSTAPEPQERPEAAHAPLPVTADPDFPTPSTPSTPFTPPLGTLATRVRALADWIRRQTSTHELFIADSQGNPVTDRPASPELVTAALVVSDSSRRALQHLPHAGDAAIHIDLPDDRSLCIISAQTSLGTFCLGLVTSAPLAARTAQRFRLALRTAVETEPPSRRERW
jgi:hypothetical protein